MKKHLLSIVSLTFATLLTGNVFAQRTAVRTVASPEKGTAVEFGTASVNQKPSTVNRDANVLWEVHETYAIGQDVFFIQNGNKSIVNWQLNDQRITQYAENGDVDWEVATTADFTRLSANETGTLALIIDGDTLRAVNPANGSVVWTKCVSGSIRDAIPTADGERVFLAVSGNDGSSHYECYNVGVDTPVWSQLAPSAPVIMSLPVDESKLMVCFGSDIKKAYIVDPETGALLQGDIYYYNNSPTQRPGMSADGEFMVVTDFSGNATLYRWDGTRYNQQWSTSVAGPGASSTWGAGSAISYDGSTIAVGTLDFVSTGSGYDGSLFVFNNYSNEPVWVKNNIGDQVGFIDMTDDGSLIAIATYGPIDHSTPDFYAFRRQSPEPVSSINTPGCFEYLDLSSDGSRCVMAGKAVHPREMGWGGQAYYVNPLPANAGNLAGTVQLQGTADHGNVSIEIAELDDYYTTSKDNGEYALKYIPAGTYTVTFSKPGYLPITMNAEITANETTTLDVLMEQVGTPVSNFYASQGAYDFVKLIWTAADNCIGYNIYRKTSEIAPFEAPLATIGNQEAAYEDLTAIPTQNYYYAVTAILEGGLETPYSNCAMGYASTAFIVNEIDVYDGAAPTIDGVMSAGEWDDAFGVDVSNYLIGSPVGSVMMYFKQDNNYLYGCSVNTLDNAFNDNDGIAMYIDDNNDGSFPETGDDSEGNYWMYYGSAGNTVRYRPIYNTGGVGTVVNLPEEIIACSMSEGYEVIEFALPFGSQETWQINPSADNKSGLYLFVRNAETAVMDGKWPADNEDTFSPVGYGVMNYHVTDAVPAAPTNLRVEESILWSGQYAPLSWDMPDIHDLDHFNVYLNSSSVTNTTTGTQIILDVEENTTYNVYVTTVDKAGHESAASETLTFTSGNLNVPEMEQSTFRLYPNPVRSTLTIASDVEGSGYVKIFDVMGRMVKSFAASDLKTTQVSVDGFESGVYFAVINYDNVMVIRKFVVE